MVDRVLDPVKVAQKFQAAVGNLAFQFSQYAGEGRVFEGSSAAVRAKGGSGISQERADGGSRTVFTVHLPVVVVGAPPLDRERDNGTVQFFQSFQVLDAQNIIRVIEHKGYALFFGIL